MPAVHGCLHERSPQSSSTESSFLASTNPVLILTTESFQRGRPPSVLPRCSFRQSPKSHQSTASALLRFTRIQATNPYKITRVVTIAGAALPQKTSFPTPTKRVTGCPIFFLISRAESRPQRSTYPFSAGVSLMYRWRLVTTPSRSTPSTMRFEAHLARDLSSSKSAKTLSCPLMSLANRAQCYLTHRGRSKQAAG